MRAAACAQIMESRKTRDRFSERGAQTFHLPTRTKEVQASPPALVGDGVLAAPWEIFDAFHKACAGGRAAAVNERAFVGAQEEKEAVKTEDAVLAQMAGCVAASLRRRCASG
jgi:hypothetical protein